MRMTGHQRRLWQKMIDLIQHYLEDKETNDFYFLVGELEGFLDASEIKDDMIVSQWYDFWTPLEIRRAIEGNNVNREKAREELMRMKQFLLKTICMNESEYLVDPEE